MNRIVTIVIVVLVSLPLLAACGGGDEPTPTSGAAVEPTATLAPSATPTVSPTPVATVTAMATATGVPTATPRPIATSTVAPSPTATPAPPAPTPDPVVSSDLIFDGMMVDGEFKLRYAVIDADGSNLRWLTHGPDAYEGWLRVSPDGREAAFIRDHNGVGGLFIVDIATGEERLIVPGRAWAEWSPDGTRLVLDWQAHSTGAACCGGNREFEDPPRLAMVAADGTNLWIVDESVLTDTYGWVFVGGGEWSPDGSKLLYTRFYSYSRGWDQPPVVENPQPWSELVVVNADGSGERVYAIGSATYVENTAWTADGAAIVYLEWHANGATWLMRMALEGGTPLRLTPPELQVGDFGFVPGQERLWFRVWDRGVFTVALDGSGLAELTDAGTPLLNPPIYAPDGSRFVFIRPHVDPAKATWLLVNAEGVAQELPVTGYTSTGISWSPDGTRLAFVSGQELRVFEIATGHTTVLALVSVAEAGGGRVTWLPH